MKTTASLETHFAGLLFMKFGVPNSWHEIQDLRSDPPGTAAPKAPQFPRHLQGFAWGHSGAETSTQSEVQR